MMKPQDKEKISLYLDGQLSKEEEKEITGLLSSDDSCREYYEQIKMIVKDLRDLPDVSLSENISASILDALSDKGRRKERALLPRILPRLAMAAGFMLVLVSVFQHYSMKTEEKRLAFQTSAFEKEAGYDVREIEKAVFGKNGAIKKDADVSLKEEKAFARSEAPLKVEATTREGLSLDKDKPEAEKMKKLETPQYFSGKERVFQLVLQNKSVLKEIEKNLISAGAENVQVLEEQLKITAEVLPENFKGLEDRLRDLEVVSFKEDPYARGGISGEDQREKVFIVIEYSFN